MRTIPVLLLAAISASCAMTPAEIRQREPAGSALMKGDERAAKQCLAGYFSSRNMPYSFAVLTPIADELGMRVQCARQGICMLVEFSTDTRGTTATGYSAGTYVSPGLDDLVRDALAACKA